LENKLKSTKKKCQRKLKGRGRPREGFMFFEGMAMRVVGR
jgi:hypothetical protein